MQVVGQPSRYNVRAVAATVTMYNIIAQTLDRRDRLNQTRLVCTLLK